MDFLIFASVIGGAYVVGCFLLVYFFGPEKGDAISVHLSGEELDSLRTMPGETDAARIHALIQILGGEGLGTRPTQREA